MAKPNDPTKPADPSARTEPAPGAGPAPGDDTAAELARLRNALDEQARRTATLESENNRLRDEADAAKRGKGKEPPRHEPPRARGFDALVPGRVVHYMKPLPLVVPVGHPLPRELGETGLPLKPGEEPVRELAPQAAIVINVHDDGAADLKVFFTNGAEHTLKRVPYADEPTKGAWSWPARA